MNNYNLSHSWVQEYAPPQNFLNTEVEKILQTNDFKEANQIIDKIKNIIKGNP